MLYISLMQGVSSVIFHVSLLACMYQKNKAYLHVTLLDLSYLYCSFVSFWLWAFFVFIKKEFINQQKSSVQTHKKANNRPSKATKRARNYIPINPKPPRVFLYSYPHAPRCCQTKQVHKEWDKKKRDPFKINNR